MLENIVNKLSLTQSDFKVEDVDDYILRTQLRNGKILGESFEDLAPLYKSLCDKYLSFIEKLLTSGSANLKNNNFVDFANNISEAYRHLGIAREHLGYANLDEKLDLLKIQFISSLKERFNNSIAALEKERIEKINIEALKDNISIIKAASDVHNLRKLIAENDIGNLLSLIMEKYQAYFEKSKAHVLSIINNKETRNISEIEANFDEFVLLMEVPDIEYLIAASYQDTLRSLESKINFYKNEAKGIIKSFSNSPESVDFAPLRDCFACLESGKWIEKFSKGIYSNELSVVEKEINSFIDKLLAELKEIDLGYQFPINVSKGYSIVQKMREVVQLKEFIPSVENCDKIIIGIFEKRVQESLKFIKRELNPELQDSERENKEIENLRGIRLKYTQGEEAKESTEKLQELVRNNGFENIEDVDKKIKEIENFIQKFNERLEEGTVDVDKIENSYLYIEECKKIPELFETTEAISKSILVNLINLYNRNFGSLTEFFNSVPIKIKAERFTDIESIKTFSHQTALRFKEILLLSTKSPSFSKYYDMEPYYRRYSTKLDELGDIFSEKLKLSDENSTFQKMSSLLVIVNEFAIVNDNFKSLSAKYEKILSTKLTQTCKSILESIEIHSFDRVNQLIKCLDEATWNDNKDIAKDRSHFTIELILTEAKESALNISNSKLDHPLIAKILKNIGKVTLAKQN
ncbi:unnamed protein product [Blepharisma stoltei]|uniref:Uncharacterized protein n=1 Tax=Blepharisma stoltei TaxID=1481888 RepID=A0AAU9IRY0_9CILI|nr:unnamed protein product [Blepharisma stoltei]